MRTELREQSEFIKILKALGFIAYKVTASRKGVPDIEAFKPKSTMILKFELKAVGGMLSEQQKKYFEDYPYTFLVVKRAGKFYVSGKHLEVLKDIQSKKIILK